MPPWPKAAKLVVSSIAMHSGGQCLLSTRLWECIGIGQLTMIVLGKQWSTVTVTQQTFSVSQICKWFYWAGQLASVKSKWWPIRTFKVKVRVIISWWPIRSFKGKVKENILFSKHIINNKCYIISPWPLLLIHAIDHCSIGLDHTWQRWSPWYRLCTQHQLFNLFLDLHNWETSWTADAGYITGTAVTTVTKYDLKQTDNTTNFQWGLTVCIFSMNTWLWRHWSYLAMVTSVVWVM